MAESFIFQSPSLLTEVEIKQINNSITNPDELNLFIAQLYPKVFDLIRVFRGYYPSADEVINSPLFGFQNKILRSESRANLATDENKTLWEVVISNQISRLEIIRDKSVEFNISYSDLFVSESLRILRTFCTRILMSDFC